MKKTKKMLSLVAMMLLVAMLSVAGTVAWMTANTDTITNTFVVGNITLELDEHVYDQKGNVLTGNLVDDNGGNANYKLIPGLTMPKDPYVTVGAGSEACWVFVEIEEVNNPTTYIDYTVDSNWKKVKDGVYYMAQADLTEAEKDAVHAILTNDQVKVKNDVTQAQLALIGDNKPALKFTAYAIQSANLVDESGAALGEDEIATIWSMVSGK